MILENIPTADNRQPMARKKIALLGIYHETNTFIGTATTMDDFRNGYWLEGDAIRREYQGAHHEISGVIDVVDACDDMELVPVFYVSATPGGLIAKDAYESIVDQMMIELDRVLPVGGCIVVPHGAGVAEGYPDMDGHWLTLLRKKLGHDIPVTGTLDPHANVSQAMIEATDVLIAYSTNPHVDQHETGRKAALILVESLRGNMQPAQQLVQLPLQISIEQQHTSTEPCKSLYEYIANVKKQQQLLSASVLLGFPYADVAELGSAFILVEDKNKEHCSDLGRVAVGLTDYMHLRKEEFNGVKTSIASVYGNVSHSPKPILMLDMGDNVGGGAPGDSTHLLEFLENEKSGPVFICIFDPTAVAIATGFKAGEAFVIAFGENSRKYKTTVTLSQILDGIFTEDSPKHGGFVNYDMGPSVIVKTVGGNTVMLTTKRTPPYSLRQMTSFGLDPKTFEIIVAKGVNAPIAAYASVCPSIMQVDTPGVTQADMTLFDYKNRRKPMFPFES